MLWVVAGCLFEVSFPTDGGPWRWAESRAEVTLLAEDRRDGHHHFRFRAEQPGRVELLFSGPEPVTVTVHIAPERLA